MRRDRDAHSHTHSLVCTAEFSTRHNVDAPALRTHGPEFTLFTGCACGFTLHTSRSQSVRTDAGSGFRQECPVEREEYPLNGWIVLLFSRFSNKPLSPKRNFECEECVKSCSCVQLRTVRPYMHHLTLQYSPEGAEATHQLGWSEVTGRVHML